METTAVTELLSGLTSKEFAALRKRLGKDIAEDEAIGDDKPLKEPIPFYNDKYRSERIFVAGRRKPIQFVDGLFVARTTAEAETLRVSQPHIFEGDDLKKDSALECGLCKRKFLNSKLYQYHMNRHNE